MGTLTDAQLARQIAFSAGKLLREIGLSRLLEGKNLGIAGDCIANTFILEALKFHRPDDAILSEEETADEARLHSRRVWIVDPLDGTREFGEHRTDWAVHIALAIDGRPEVGAVALPGMDQLLCSDNSVLAPSSSSRLRMLVSRTRPAPEAVAVAKMIDAELVSMGSAGAKAMAVVRGEADIYLHTGGQYEWDSCAPVAVALAAGLHCSRADGTLLVYNRPDVYLPDILICRQECVRTVLDTFARLAPPSNWA